nr:hypothetical protein [Tanacetum cinerariifolium]
MSQKEIQQSAYEEAWIPKADRVKISTINIRIDPTMTQKEETYQVSLEIIKKPPSTSPSLPLLMYQKSTSNNSGSQSLRSRTQIAISLSWQTRSVNLMLRCSVRLSIFAQDFKEKSSLYLHQKRNCSPFSPELDTREDLSDVYQILYWPDTAKEKKRRRISKKKVSISTNDNIIPEPNVALELEKSMSLTKVAEEEAARQVLATHERIVMESDPKPTRRRPSEQLIVDMMQALKASKKSSRSQPHAEGSSEGTGMSPKVADESIVVLITSSGRTGTKPGVPDEYEYVHDNVDEEIKDAEVADTGKGDEEITVTSKADVGKTEEVKDDDKKAKLPPSSFSLSIPHIQSPSIVTAPVSVIPEPIVLSPIPEIPTETSAITIPPPLSVTSIILVLQQQSTPIPTPPITTVALVVTRMSLKSQCKQILLMSTVKKALEKTLIVLAQSSSQAQSSLKAAESLSEYELKMILYEKMEKVAPI